MFSYRFLSCLPKPLSDPPSPYSCLTDSVVRSSLTVPALTLAETALGVHDAEVIHPEDLVAAKKFL